MKKSQAIFISPNITMLVPYEKTEIPSRKFYKRQCQKLLKKNGGIMRLTLFFDIYGKGFLKHVCRNILSKNCFTTDIEKLKEDRFIEKQLVPEGQNVSSGVIKFNLKSLLGT